VILGSLNDAEVTLDLAVSLVTRTRLDLAGPAKVPTKWSNKRQRTVLRSVERTLDAFRAEAPFRR